MQGMAAASMVDKVREAVADPETAISAGRAGTGLGTARALVVVVGGRQRKY